MPGDAQKSFFVRPPRGKRLPILVSAPHVGTEFPPEIRGKLKPEIAERPVDTDWFVHDLYEFAPELGITLIHARYSRMVVDLNRPADSKPLYNDGRRETGVVPVTTFEGDAIYAEKADESAAASPEERARRLALYHKPYHDELARLLRELRAEAPQVLLFDAHSIRPFVTAIRKERFPDLILGDQEGKTAHPALTKSALTTMRTSSYSVAHNDPFKGGYITRNTGKPETGVHALQLEMSQSVYMNEALDSLDQGKLAKIRPLLREVLTGLASVLGTFA